MLGGPLAGVPSFFIDSFAIPPFLLPIYQAAGADYGIPWQVLAAINEVETDYGRDLNVSSAGAEGWMQFMPATWSEYGVDVNSDGYQDPYNPADAIFAAARYLKAAGGNRDIRTAVFAYNHSQSYVRSVMLRARLLGGTPPSLLRAVSGLTEARFPVHAPAHFGDGFPAGPTGQPLVGTAIYSEPDAPAIAVQDGKVVSIGDSPELGPHVSLVDAYGNRYTYAELGTLSTLYPVIEGHKRFSLHPLRAGAHVIAGTVLGHLDYGAQPHLVFQLRPAGAGAPLIDPKPILDGWVKLQDTSAIHVKGPHPFDAAHAIPGQVLLESKGQLERSVEADRSIGLPACERTLIAGGRIDRRLLVDLAFLASTGSPLRIAPTSCAEGAPGAFAGIESVDVAAIGGVAAAREGHVSGPAATAVRRLLRLQGAMRPLSIVGPRGLPSGGGVVSSSAQAASVRISFERPAGGPLGGARAARLLGLGLSPQQWIRLVARLGQIPDPEVSAKPSAAAVPDAPASAASVATGGRG
jgi:Transglycosylase SLT domain